MTGLFKYPPVELFRKMRGLPEFPSDQKGAGDVISHLSTSASVRSCVFTSALAISLILAISLDLPTSGGGSVHCTMLPNPSHLEAVNPVAAGKVRARYMSSKGAEYGNSQAAIGDDVICVQVR